MLTAQHLPTASWPASGSPITVLLMTWMIKDVLVIETAVATFVAPVTRTAEDISVTLRM